eukprot:2233645-Pleurochrysis_carterae.AAC.1
MDVDTGFGDRVGDSVDQTGGGDSADASGFGVDAEGAGNSTNRSGNGDATAGAGDGCKDGCMVLDGIGNAGDKAGDAGDKAGDGARIDDAADGLQERVTVNATAGGAGVNESGVAAVNAADGPSNCDVGDGDIIDEAGGGGIADGTDGGIVVGDCFVPEDADGNVADGPSNSGAEDGEVADGPERDAAGGADEDEATASAAGHIADGAFFWDNAVDIAGNGDAAGAGGGDTVDGSCAGVVAGAAGEGSSVVVAGHCAEDDVFPAGDGAVAAVKKLGNSELDDEGTGVRDLPDAALADVVADTVAADGVSVKACEGTVTNEAGAAANEADIAELADEETGVRDLADASRVGVGIADTVACKGVAIDAAKGDDIGDGNAADGERENDDHSDIVALPVTDEPAEGPLPMPLPSFRRFHRRCVFR